MYDGRAKSDVVAEISVVEDSSSMRSKFPPIPSDENVAQRIDFLSNFLVYHTIVNAPAGPSRMLVCPTTREDSEEVRVYARSGVPALLGKGLQSPMTDGLELLGEATGIVRFEPADHALVAAALDWLVGIPGQSSGFGFAHIASEHEELAQYLMTLQRLQTLTLPGELLFMEVDFQEEFNELRSSMYPAILDRDASGER